MLECGEEWNEEGAFEIPDALGKDSGPIAREGMIGMPTVTLVGGGREWGQGGIR